MKASRYIPLVARICLATIFIQTGLSKISNFGGTQQQIASAGLPLAALVTLFTIVFEIAGGTSLILGYRARAGAVLLLAFLIPATLVFHNFILDSTQTIQFMKNLAIMGGLLMVVANGPGPVSMDRPDAPMRTRYLGEEAQ